MRFFTASPEILNSLRSAIMEQYNMPNDYAEQPWNLNQEVIALAEREYTPPEYAMLITTALDMGVREITAEEYSQIQQKFLNV